MCFMGVSWHLNFNSRSRTGSDSRSIDGNTLIPISIHAPAQGATRPKYRLPATCGFQFTLPHRERLFVVLQTH